MQQFYKSIHFQKYQNREPSNSIRFEISLQCIVFFTRWERKGKTEMISYISI